MRYVRDCVIRENPSDPRWLSLLKEARIPDRYAHASLQGILSASERTLVEQHLAVWKDTLSKGNGYFFNGPLGSGKSSIAGLFAKNAVSRGEQVTWIPVRHIPAIQFGQNQELDKRIEESDLLIIDDLGAEHFSLGSAAGTALEEMFRRMYERQRSVIVTSNIKWDDLEAVYNEVPALISVIKRTIAPIVILGGTA